MPNWYLRNHLSLRAPALANKMNRFKLMSSFMYKLARYLNFDIFYSIAAMLISLMV